MRTLLLMVALLFSTLAIANGSDPRTGTIKGRVIDVNLNQPLPYVNIVVKDKNNETLTGGITDEEGNFEIEKIPEGTVLVSVQYIGYKTLSKNVTLESGNFNINLGDILLEEDVSNLDEVTVVAEISTIQQKVDRKVITIGKDLATTGPTAADIMQNLPSVSVDQQTGDISLRGNQNVRVMVDGKLSNIPAAQLLKQLPSSSIKQIELITNPSAKYNPEGMSGIINIILHKNINVGFNGNIGVGLSYEKEPKFNSNIDMNYRNNKLNFYGNYGNNISRNVNGGYIDRVEQNTLQLIDVLDENKSHLFKFGIDYYLDDKNTLSAFTNQNIYNGETIGRTDIIYDNNPSQNLIQRFLNEGDNISSQYNFDYKRDFAKEGHNIELEVDYNMFDSDQLTNNLLSNTSFRPNFFEDNHTERNQTTVNLDYVNPLSETTKLELGLQALLFDNAINYESDARNRNEAGNYIPTNTYYTYARDIYSVYATYSKKLEKWSYQFGLRAENVKVETLANQTDLTSGDETKFPFDNDYFQVYPSAFITYNPSEKNSYQLSYSRRVDRPGIGQVNPIPDWSTPLITQYGNQFLEPQYTNSIEVNYTRQLEKGSVTAGVFYRLIQDEISQALLVDRTDLNRLLLTFDNFDNTSAYGVEFSSNYKPTKWWSLNGSFDLYTQTQKSIGEVLTAPSDTATEDDIILKSVSVDNVAWNFRVFNNFKVSESLTFSAFGFYRGKNKSIQFNIEPMYFVNVGMRYTFLPDDRMTFSLNYNDIFDTMKFQATGIRPFKQKAQFEWESQTVFAGLTYRFGGGKFSAKKRKRRDDNEKDDGGGFF
ncbi:Outer membrane receptor proteins, mostly Fe transport [Flavobacteriaceae bacterium MAR_2010_188]|nr:Outer membrane receptor proteins, mostly Fe transport [Flavobacteriaceae bacterium MAR_2010_188]